MMEDVSRESFEAYVKVQKSNVTNMLDVKRVGQLSGLQREIIMDIMENYGALKDKYKEESLPQEEN